jgi:Arc/MetJ family transcription regulator
MRTNIVIDDELMERAMKEGGFRTKREAVEAGLRRIVESNRYAKMIALRGKVGWVGDLDRMRLDKPRRPARHK